MASIFPGVQPVLTAAENELPMCREVKSAIIRCLKTARR